MATLRSNKASAVAAREELAKTLLSSEEQQRLVNARADRLLDTGNSPPRPPMVGLFKDRKQLRQEVTHMLDDAIKYDIKAPAEERYFAEDPQAAVERYAQQQRESACTAETLARTEESIDMRVEYRDYLNQEALDEETKLSLADAAAISKRADVAIDAHVRAEWMLDPPEISQRADLDRERRLFEEAQAVIQDDPIMRKDYQKHHIVGSSSSDGFGGSGIGSHGTNVRSEAESEAFVEMIRQRDEKSKKLKDGRASVAAAAATANAAEDRVRAMATELEKRSRSMGFDERVRERKKMLRAKEEADALTEASNAEKARFEALRVDLGEDDGMSSNGSVGFAPSQPRCLVIWLLGITDGATIGTCFFGNYSQDDQPPVEHWLPFNDAERDTKLTVKYPRSTQPSAAGNLTITLSGTVAAECSGKYSQDGVSDNVIKYTNPEGISLFRARLYETPELGITSALIFEKEEAPKKRPNARGGKGKDNEEDKEGEDDNEEDGFVEGDAAAREAELLRRSKSVDVYDLAGEQLNNEAFWPLRGVGLRMIVTGLREQVVRRQAYKASIEKLVEAEFEEEMARAAASLKAVTKAGAVADGDAGDQGAPRGPKIDYTALMMQAPNTTYMMSDADVVSRLPGSDRVIPTSAASVPPLCRAWVLLSCPMSATACRKRHYYVNQREREQNSEVRQAKEQSLDMDVLMNISTREALLEGAREAGTASMAAYLQDTDAAVVEHRHVANLLALLDRLRLVSVACIEAIGRWRDHQDAMRSLTTGGGSSASDLKGHWAVTVQVTGPELYKASAAFRSKVKRLQRDREEPKKAVEFHYLGVFPTKSDAARCYDRHIAMEAARKGTNPNRLPAKRFVARSCGKHFVVEPEGAPRGRPCEQCLVAKIGRGAGGGFKPPYLWEGGNYLLKMLTDTEFLAEVDTLNEFVNGHEGDSPDGAGSAAALDTEGNPLPKYFWNKNPLLLAPELASAGSRGVVIGPSKEYLEAVAAKEAADEAKRLKKLKRRGSSRRGSSSVGDTSRSNASLQSADGSMLRAKHLEPLEPLTPTTPLTGLGSGWGSGNGGADGWGSRSQGRQSSSAQGGGGDRRGGGGGSDTLDSARGDGRPRVPPLIKPFQEPMSPGGTPHGGIGGMQLDSARHTGRSETGRDTERSVMFEDGTRGGTEEAAAADAARAKAKEEAREAARVAALGLGSGRNSANGNGSDGGDSDSDAGSIDSKTGEKKRKSRRRGSDSSVGSDSSSSSTLGRHKGVLLGAYRFGSPAGAFTTTRATKSSGGDNHILELGGGGGKSSKHAPVGLGGHFLQSEVFGAAAALHADDDSSNGSMGGLHSGAPYEAGVEMLDMVRIRKALKDLEQEQLFATWAPSTPQQAPPDPSSSTKKRAKNAAGSSGTTTTAAATAEGGDGSGSKPQTASESRPGSPGGGSGVPAIHFAAEGEYGDTSSDDDSDDDGSNNDKLVFSAAEEAKEEERLLKLLAGKQGKQVAETLAIYEEGGASLAIPQSRPKDPTRIDGLFCRRDKGKWKGVGIPGTEMKRFEFAEKLVIEGKRRNRARDRLGLLIRVEYARPLNRVRKNRLRNLLSKATALRGSRLTLDIVTAERFLTRYLAMVKASLVVQRYTRGLFGRQAAKARTALLASKSKERRAFEVAVAAAAVDVVKKALTVGLRKATRQILKPLYTAAKVLDGTRCVVLVRSLAHSDYVERSIPVDQLPSSSSSSSSSKGSAFLRGVGGGAGRPAPPPRATYSLATATYETTAAMDTTERVRPPERLLFEAYDPTTGATAGLTTQEQELRVRLTSQEMNQDWGELLPAQRPPPEFSQMKAEAAERGAKARQASAEARQKAAERREKKNNSRNGGVAKSMARTMAWQEEEGIDRDDDVSSSSMGPEVDDDDDDDAQACAEAEVDHLMASIGRKYGEDKETNGHYPTRAVSRALQLQATAIDRGLNYGTSEWAAAKEDDRARRLRGLMVRPDAHVVPRTRWEPAYEATVLGAAWKDAVTLSGFMARAATWTLAMQAAAQQQVNDSFAAYERSQMAYQDAWAVLLKACAEYNAATEGTRQALAFSAGTIADFAHPEKEDWAQSYEPFEDGNNWKQLRRKRTAGFAQAAAARNAKAAAAKIGHLRRTWLAAKDWLLLWDARATNQIRRREQAAMAAEEASQLGHTAQANLREACDRAWSVMSLRHRSTVPAKRQLLWREHAWTLAPSPDAIKASAANPSAAAPGGYENRLEKPLLRAWNHLWREARVVHSAVAPGLSAPRLSKRFLVTLRQDASLLEGGGGPGGGLSGLTTLLVESCAAETAPVVVVLTATELEEVVAKVDPRLVRVLTHPWRPSPTQHGSEGATAVMEQAAQAQWIKDGPLGEGSCFSSEMPSSDEENDDDGSDDDDDDARSLASGSTSLSLLHSPGSKGGSTSSPMASVQGSTSIVSSSRNNNLPPTGLAQASRNSVSYGSMSPEQKKAAAKARRAQAAKDQHAAKEARAAALGNRTALIFAKAQDASIKRRLRVGPELDVGWREIDALAPGFRSAVTAEISHLEAQEILAEAQAAEEAEALRVKKAKEKAKKEAAMDGEVATRVQQKLKAAVYGTSPTVFFSRYDSDKSGTLDVAEFKKCVRVALKVAPKDLSDADLDTFAANLDDDGSGDLDIAELADFVERGTATFGETAAGEDDDDVSKFATKKWGDKEDGAVAKQREQKLAELQAKKVEEEARVRRAARRAKRRRKMDVQEMHQARAHAMAMQLAMAPDSMLLKKVKNRKKMRGQKLKVKGWRQKFTDADAISDDFNAGHSTGAAAEGHSTTSAVALLDPLLLEPRAPVPESPSSSTNLTLFPPLPPPSSSQHLQQTQSQILAVEKTVPGAANAAARARRGAAMTLRRYRDLRLARCKDVCAAILSSLKLDVYSGAITVGNVGFARTRNRVAAMFTSSGGDSASALSDDASSAGALTATTAAGSEGAEADSSAASASSAGGCRWWQDLTAKRSSMRTHTNEVLREARAVGGRLCTLVVYENWGDLLFEAYDPESRHTYAVNASLAQCVTALSDEPQALQAYLLSVRLNEWPRAVVLTLADRVDLSLPGEDSRWWRRPLRHERPRATLLPRRHLRFRGPIWRDDRRRVASQKVTLAAYASSRGDLRLVLSAPNDQGMGQGAYQGPPLSLELSAGELRRVLTTAGRLDLLGSDPEVCAQKMDFLCSRLFILNEDEYWGVSRGARFAQEAESYVKVASTAFSSFAKWASATRAPVLRDLTPFFDPPEAFRDVALKAAQAALAASSSSSVDVSSNGGSSSALSKRKGALGGGTSSSRQTLVLFREVDKITQCHTLYEGPWMPQAAVMATLDRDARRTEAQELALAVKHGARGSPQGPFPPRSFDETWAAEAFAVRISAMASGRLLVSLSPEHERQRTARLQEVERMSMFREENLSRAQALRLAAFQREASRLAEKADAEKSRAAAAAVRAREQRRVQNERVLQRQMEWRRRTALARAWAEEASDTCDALLNALIWHRADEEDKTEEMVNEAPSPAPNTEKEEETGVDGEEKKSAETADSAVDESEVNKANTSKVGSMPAKEETAAPSVYMGPALDLNLALGAIDEPLAPGTINLSASLASWRSSQNSNASLGEASGGGGGSVTSSGGGGGIDVGHDAFCFEKQPDKNGLVLFQPSDEEKATTSSTAEAATAEVSTGRTKATKLRSVRLPLGRSAQAAAAGAGASAQSSGAALQRRGHHGLHAGAGDATRRAFPGKGGSFVLGVNRFRKLPPTSRTVAGVAAELAGWPQGTPALPTAPPSHAPPTTTKARGSSTAYSSTAASSSEVPLPGLPWACDSDVVLAEKVQRLPWWVPLPPDEEDDDASIVMETDGAVAAADSAVAPAVIEGESIGEVVVASAEEAAPAPTSPPRSALFGKLKKAAATVAATSGAVRRIGQVQEASAAAAAAAQAWAAVHPPHYCLVRVVLRGLRFTVEVYEPRTGSAYALKVYSPFVRATRAFMTTLATSPVPAPLPPLMATAAPRKGGKGGKGNKLTKAATSVGKIAGAFGGRGGRGNSGKKRPANSGSSSGGSGASSSSSSTAGLGGGASLEVAMAKEAKREALQMAAEQRAARAATDPVGLAVDILADLIADASLYEAMHELKIPSSRAPGGRRKPGPTPRAAQLVVQESLSRAATKRRDDLRLDAKRIAAKYPDTQRRPGRSVADGTGSGGGGGGGLLSVGAARWSEQEANRGPPSNFSARLVGTNPTATSVPIQVGLATWSSDLAKWLKARPGEELRKLNVKASQMKGATLVCRNHRSKDNRAAQLVAATAHNKSPSTSDVLAVEGSDKRNKEEADWNYNHKASAWRGAAVYGPAVWVLSNSASGSATTVTNFDASDVAFGEAHAAAEANHAKRMAWREEQLSTTKQAYSSFLDTRNARLEPFLVRACAARGALHAADHLLQTTSERRMTVGRKKGYARERERGFGLMVPARHHGPVAAYAAEVKEGAEDSATSSVYLETLSCGGVDLTLVEEATQLADRLAAIRASCEKQKTAFGEQITPGGQWSDPGYSESTIASMERKLAQDEKAARKLEARIEELPESLRRRVAHRLKVKREEHLRVNGSDGNSTVAASTVSASGAPSVADTEWEYVEWPHLCVSHLHALRAAAESTPLAARADPFSLIDDASTSPQGGTDGGSGGSLPFGFDGDGDGDDEEDEGDHAAALAAHSRPPLEPDDEWAADLPAPGEVLPWTWWLSLLQYHTRRCKLPPAACPVPCCGRARQSVNDFPREAPLSSSSTGSEQSSVGTVVSEGSQALNREDDGANSSSLPSAAALDQAVETCYRERLAAEARQRLVGEARQKAMQELAVAAAQGPEGLAALAAEEAREAAKAAQEGLLRKKRIAALFRRVAQAVLALLRTSKSAAANLKASMHAASFAATRRELASATAALEALDSSDIVGGSSNSSGDNDDTCMATGGVVKPIHSALGMATPGDLSFLAAQRPVAEIEADMHQLPRLLGYDDLPPLADLSKRAQATASEQAVSTFDLEARFDGGAATLTSEDAAEAAAIRDSLGLPSAAPGAQVLAELLLTYMRLTKTTAKALAESMAAEASSSPKADAAGAGAGASPPNLGSPASGGAAAKASTAMVIGQGKPSSGGHSKDRRSGGEWSDDGNDSEEEWVKAALPKKKKKKAKKIKPEDMFTSEANGVDKAKAIFLKSSATKQAKIEAAKDLAAAEARAAEAAAAAKAAANKIVYDLNLDLAYCSAMVYVSNQPLLLSVKQPKGSDGLYLVAHVPLKCTSLTLSLSPELLEDLLPPLLQGDQFVPLSRRPIASSSSSSGSSVVARGPQLSPGSDPSSLAFVGSRPSMANYLLAHAEQLFKLVKPSGGSSLGGSDSSSLGELAVAGDLSGDRARLAAQLAAQSRAAARLEQARAAMASKVAWRLLCRERALERHRLQLAARRRMDRYEVGTGGYHLAREREGMAGADAESMASRRYLACPWRDIRSLEDAFHEFDLDGNGSLDVSELQDLMFALGHQLSDEAAEQLANAVDTDCSGTVEFHEFAAWWLVREEDSDQGLHRLTTESEVSKETKKRLVNAMKERRKKQQKTALKEGGPAAALGMTPEARARAMRADRLKLARADAEITAQAQDAATYTITVAKQKGRALTRG